MVDVGGKDPTHREARATATVRMAKATRALLESGATPKGDVLATCRIAGIQAAKRTSELIPLCHPLPLSRAKVTLRYEGDDAVVIESEVACEARTGVEMEALTAVSVAALTLYDMLKAVDRAMVIEHVALLEKRGGVSGDYVRGAAASAKQATSSRATSSKRRSTSSRARTRRSTT